MARWAFLTNHAIVLFFLAKHPLITGRELSRLIGITERSVRNIISDLESEGYIKGSKEGRQVRYKTNLHLPLRHHTPKSNVSDIYLFPVGKSPVSSVSSRPPMYSGQVTICPFVSIFQTIIFITQCELPLRLCRCNLHPLFRGL